MLLTAQRTYRLKLGAGIIALDILLLGLKRMAIYFRVRERKVTFPSSLS